MRRCRILWTLRPADRDLVGAQAEILATLRTQFDDFRYLRLRLLSGTHRGDEISLHCRVQESSNLPTCNCSDYPFPHRHPGGITKTKE